MLKKLINIVKIALPPKKNKPSGEINLSAHFQKAIKDDIQCEKDKVIYVDSCLVLSMQTFGVALFHENKSLILEVNIYRLIDAIPAIKEIQKDFYKTMIFERKTKIIDYSMALLFKQGLL